jgi:hypothetical protein
VRKVLGHDVMKGSADDAPSYMFIAAMYDTADRAIGYRSALRMSSTDRAQDLHPSLIPSNFTFLPLLFQVSIFKFQFCFVHFHYLRVFYNDLHSQLVFPLIE